MEIPGIPQEAPGLALDLALRFGTHKEAAAVVALLMCKRKCALGTGVLNDHSEYRPILRRNSPGLPHLSAAGQGRYSGRAVARRIRKVSTSVTLID